MSSRIQEWFSQIPIFTGAIFILCCVVHIYVFLADVNLGEWSISPYRVIYDQQYYRMFTAPFLHSGIMHILMNMMSLMSLGSSLELQFGTLQMMFTVLISVILTNVIYVSSSWALYAITNSRSWLFSSAVGFSGVLFHFAVLESYHTRIPVRSVFGFCNVPSKIYPWVLLVLLQVMLPNISFIGHLSGILVGILQVFGFIDRMYCFPSIARLRAIEDSEMIVCCTRRNNFVKSPLDRTLALSDTSSSCNWISTNVGRLMPSFGSSGASRDVEMNTRREANDNDENDDADSRPLLTSAPPTTTSIHEEKSGVNQAMRESWLKKYPETEGKG